MFTRWWTERLKRPKTPYQPAVRPAAMLLLAVSVAAAGCSLLPKEDEEEVLPTITPPRLSEKPTYPVTTATLETKVQGIGEVKSLKEEKILFTGAGEDSETSAGSLRVKAVYVEPGQTVEAGQLVVELDVTAKERELRRKRLEFRSRELEMIKILRNPEQIPPEELEQHKLDFELQRTELLELEEIIAGAKLTAPFPGTIVSVLVEPGDTVQEYDPVAVISDLSQLVVAANFSRDALREIAVGMEAIVNINAAGTHTGKVQRLPLETDGESGNDNDEDSLDKYVLVQLDQWPEGVTRGAPLSVSVITNRKENAVVIPPSALRTYNGRTYVQVVDEEGNKREVDVEVGMRTATQVEILQGLEVGQKVVGQ